MKKLQICIHKGGSSCRNHGGDGSSFHESGYIHPFVSGSELSEGLSPIDKSLLDAPRTSRKVEIPALESEFDEDAAISMLGVTLDQGVTKSLTDLDFLSKSLFDFDLVTEEGLVKFLNLLPVIDFDIIKEVMEAIWPAYPTDGLSSSTARLELKGFILDYLDQLSQEKLESSRVDNSDGVA